MLLRLQSVVAASFVLISIGGTVCRDGVKGRSNGQHVCCVASCDKCSDDCGQDFAESSECCARDIYESKKLCVEDSDVGCTISSEVQRASKDCSVVITNSMNASTTLRVALVFSGLMRSVCPVLNFKEVFLNPLRLDKKENYIVDVIVSVNLVKYEKPYGGDVAPVSADPLSFLLFKPCSYVAHHQGSLDKRLSRILNATCHRYGDAWNDPTCMTTMNFLRFMHAQKEAARLIMVREAATKFRYDVVVNARIDVLFTSPLPFSLYSYPPNVVIIPEWGQYRGYNDRFNMGGRDSVIKALSMLDHATEYCYVKRKKLHSESFMKWFLDTKIGANVVMCEDLKMRRVRSGDKLMFEEYPSDQNCAIETMDSCVVDAIKTSPVCTLTHAIQSKCRPVRVKIVSFIKDPIHYINEAFLGAMWSW